MSDKIKNIVSNFTRDGQDSLASHSLIHIRKSELVNKKKRQDLVLPLYFGWEIVIHRDQNWRQHVFGPFKTYWQYISAVLVLVILTSVFIWANYRVEILAATYNFTQTSWAGGVSGTTATHASNRTGWTNYDSASSTLNLGTEITLNTFNSSTATFTDSTWANFNAGTTSTVEALTNVEQNMAALRLTSSAVTPYFNTFVNISGATCASDVAFDPVSDAFWLTCNSSGHVVKLAYDGTVSSYATTTAAPEAIQFDHDTSAMWVSFEDSNATDPDYFARFATNSLTAPTYSISSGNSSKTLGTFGSAYDDVNDRVWFFDLSATGKMYKIDVNQTEAIQTSQSPVRDNGVASMVYDPSTQAVFASPWGGKVYKIPVDGSSPSGENLVENAGDDLVLDNFTNSVWLPQTDAYNFGNLLKISTANLAISYLYPVGLTYPISAAYSTYSRSLWAIDEEDNTIMEVNVSTGDAIRSITTGLASDRNAYYNWLDKSIMFTNSNDTVYKMHLYNYPTGTTGTFTSRIADTSGASSFNNISWTSLVPTGTTLTVKARTSSNADMSGATAWGSCDALSSGQDLSTNNCVTDGQRYAQYQASFSTTMTSTSPTLYNLSLGYGNEPSGSLISSEYDSGDATNVLGNITWTESGTGNVKLQLRTSADGNTWTDWLGPTSSSDYYTNPAGTTINSTHNDGQADRYIQYKATLEGVDGVSGPTLSDVTVTYVVNAQPELEAAPTATQNSAGTVSIAYSVRDADSTSGTATPGYVTPSFQYSSDNGDTWNDITNGLSANATSTKSVAEGAYTQYTVTWTAKTQVNGLYAAQAKIRVIIDDNEGANNTVSGDSTAFALDVKDPVAGATPIFVVATTTPATVHLSASDDTTLQACVTLDNTQTNCNAYSDTSTITLATNPDTVYVIFKDAFGNTTSANAVTPETPANIIVRDLSNLDASEYGLFVAWGSVSTPINQFANYRLWHSTDGSTYTLLTSISDKSINYYFHRGLTLNTAHYYKVTTEDTSGNVAVFSDSVNDQVNGQGGTDSTSPTITNVAVSSITTQSAVVTWDTDELSDSTVGYSTTAGNFNDEIGVATMLDTNSGRGRHQVVISGLNPNTTYYLQVQSMDPSTNEATDNNGGDGYSFSTLSGPAISGVSTLSVTNSSATITWNTDQSSISTVYYSTNADLSGSASVTDSDFVTEHTVTVTGLSTGTTYYYYVTSGVASDNNAGNYYSFITTSDAVAPVISSVTESLITDTDAIITWVTNEAATSKVSYGTTTENYTLMTEDTDLDTSHLINITNLERETTYHYVVVSSDASGNISTSTEEMFTTLEELSEETAVQQREAIARAAASGGGHGSRDTYPPVMSNIQVDTSAPNNVKVSWETNEDAISILNYGLEKADENSVLDPASLTAKVVKHKIALSNLATGASYKYKVISIDNYGNIGISPEAMFSVGSGNTVAETPVSEITPTETPNTDIITNPETPAEVVDEKPTDNNFLDFVKNVSNYFSRASSEVSISVLESGLNQYQQSLTELSSFVPPPLISGEPNITIGSDSVVISWRTDKPSNSLVSYADETYYESKLDYQQTVGNADESVADHSITILGLDPETVYHYSVRSKSQIGTSAQSRDFVFVTLPKSAAIESYTTEILSPSEAVFKWVTSVPTDSSVRYTPYRNGSLAISDSLEKNNKSLTTIHEMEINNFEAGVIYEVELFGQDNANKIISQLIPTFATSNDNLPPEIVQVKTDNALSIGKEVKVQTIISWETNEPATSRIYYQRGVGRADEALAESSPLSANYTRNHVVVVTTFSPGSIYRFQVESVDTEGNAARSRVYTILTPRQSESVFQIIVKNIESTFGWVNVFK